MVKVSELVTRFNRGESIRMEFRHYSESIAIPINSIVSRILSATDRGYLMDTMSTILREIILNAVKANAKRIYFQKNSLDINKTDEYSQGMNEFRDDVMSHLDDVREDLESSELRVIFEMKPSEEGILFSIENNSPIHPVELERLQHRMIRGRSSKDFTEIYESVFDSSEGAGLGIVLSLLLLKNSGINPETLRITPSREGVNVSFLLPQIIHPVDKTSAVREIITNEIRNLPTFPEQILELQRMCDDPEATIPAISKRIISDPSLTADVLKLSNSAGFLTGKRVSTVQEALIRIGLKELKNILTVSAARRILSSRYRRYEQVWNHCNRTAAYAAIIAREYKMDNIFEQVFIAGLLHDIGTIVLLSIDDELNKRIARIMETHIIATSSVLEEIAIGVSHAKIGEEIAIKWNFPEYLTAAISYHHTPCQAPEQYRDITTVVYLSDLICGIEKKRYFSSYAEPEVLQRFKIKNESDMDSLILHVQKQYQSGLTT